MVDKSDPHDPAAPAQPAEPRERDDGRPMLPVRVHPLVRLFLWAATLTLLLFFFESLPFVFLLFLAAAAIASLLAPVQRYVPGPRWLSGVVAGGGFIVIVLGLTFLLGWALKGPIQQQVDQWPQIKQTLNDTLQSWSNQLGLSETMTIDKLVNQIFTWFTSGGGGGMLKQAVSSVGVVFVALALIGFGSIYLLAQEPNQLIRPLGRLLGDREPALRRGIGDLEVRLRWWLLGTVISMTVVGIVAGVGFMVIGLKFALPLALLAGAAEIVPTLGPAVMFLVALLVAAAQGTTQVIGVAAVYAITQLLESYVLLPMIMKEAVRIPPIVTLFSIVLWGRLLGPLGLLLALPIDLALWTAVDQFVLKRGRNGDEGEHPP